MKNLKETFTYDMNRLTGITLKRSSGQDLHCGVSYDALGRMTSKQAVTAVNGTPQVPSVFSQPAFDATKIHAINSAQSISDLFPATAQTVTYTGFDKADKIKQGNDSICYTYGYDHQRIFMEEHFGNTVRTKHYVGMCEYVTEANGTKSWTYLTGPYGVFAVIEKRNGLETPHYVLKDNLGSWTTITDGIGTVEQQLSYDAWGNLRNPNTWANYTAGDSFDKPMFERGFTGHEHLTAFDLINMNGRMYDPVMSSFLSADRYVQDPSSAMGFNRYAYCMYNPLRFVDPTGWLAGHGGGGYPRSVSGLIQDYLSDPCYVTREQLKEAGIYNIEGGYGYAGGGGTMGAHWMDGFGTCHYSSWYIQTEGGGFDAGAWAIPASFNTNWVNDCQGYCDYGAASIDNAGTGASAISSYFSLGANNGGLRKLSNWINIRIQKTIKNYKTEYELSNFVLGTKIASYAGSDFNKKMFWNYWYGQGDYELSSSEFEDIVSLSIQTKEPYLSEWNGNPAFAAPVTLYGTTYANAIGTTTLFFDLNGNAIGIHEPYDFNLFPIRDSRSAQIKTTLVWGASLYNVHDKDFYINYNYHP